MTDSKKNITDKQKKIWKHGGADAVCAADITSDMFHPLLTIKTTLYTNVRNAIKIIK